MLVDMTNRDTRAPRDGFGPAWHVPEFLARGVGIL